MHDIERNATFMGGFLQFPTQFTGLLIAEGDIGGKHVTTLKEQWALHRIRLA